MHCPCCESLAVHPESWAQSVLAGTVWCRRCPVDWNAGSEDLLSMVGCVVGLWFFYLFGFFKI